MSQEAEFKIYGKNKRYPGKVEEGKMITFEYEVENTGDVPLIIKDYKVTCPCTKPIYPSKPIMPDEKVILKATFDTKGKIAYQDRKIEIISNAKGGPHYLRFRVMVDNK
jgi:hypothetical protein